MICNCNNHGNNTIVKPKIPHVQGNVLRLAIPLTLRTIEVVNGEASYTDTDFIPSSTRPVKAELTKGLKTYVIDVEMRNGNVAYIEDKGKLPVGTYDITITCFDDNGNPYRFNRAMVLHVVKSTAEAGIISPIEYETKVWYLDAAIYLALKGEDGVGIDDITTTSSSEIGGLNTVTIILTDGRTKAFTIMNGSGSVDSEFDLNSLHPVSNGLITARFDKIDESIGGMFGDVDYDSNTKAIRFFDKGKSKVLATLDAHPFIKDGMVNSVYISNNTLVITFNTDSGREAIGVPLSSVFNPNNYYNKTQVDNRIAQAIASVQVDTSGLAQLNQVGSVKYSQASKTILDFIEDIGEIAEEGYKTLLGSSNGHIYYVNESSRRIDLGVAPDQIFYDKNTEAFYRWNGSSWQKSSSRGSGINATYDSINERLIFPAGSAVVVNERLIIKT